MEKEESTHKQVKKALLQGRRLTSLDILGEFRAFRGSSIIHRLRGEGIPVKTNMIQVGSGKTVAQYYVCTLDRLRHSTEDIIRV